MVFDGRGGGHVRGSLASIRRSGGRVCPVVEVK
jgi:hypothetical protein